MQIIIFTVVSVVIVGIIGMAGIDRSNSYVTLAEVVLRGMVYVFALFQLLAVPAIYAHMSLKGFSWLIVGSLVVLAVVCAVLRSREFPNIVDKIKNQWTKPGLWNFMAIALILFQVFMAVAYYNINDDDAFYVATATTSVETDSLYVINPYTGDPFAGGFPARYVLSPFPLFYSVISYFTGVSATIIAHVVMHAIFIAVAYGLYQMIGKTLFPENTEKQGIFLTTLSVVNICSLGAEHLQGSMLLLRIWQGKAVLAAILLPLLILVLWRMHENRPRKGDYFFLFCLMMACSFVSSMGIVLGAVALGVYAFTTFILERRFKKFIMSVCCAIPNIVYALIYVGIR